MGFKAFNIIMALLFVLAASVQLLPSYGAAAFALGAFLWALTLVPTFWGQVSLTDVFGYVGMKTEEVEVAREFGGLMIVAVWMGVLERR